MRLLILSLLLTSLCMTSFACEKNVQEVHGPAINPVALIPK